MAWGGRGRDGDDAADVARAHLLGGDGELCGPRAPVARCVTAARGRGGERGAMRGAWRALARQGRAGADGDGVGGGAAAGARRRRSTGVDLLHGAIEGAEEPRWRGEAGADGGLERSHRGLRVRHARVADGGVRQPTQRNCRLREYPRFSLAIQYFTQKFASRKVTKFSKNKKIPEPQN